MIFRPRFQCTKLDTSEGYKEPLGKLFFLMKLEINQFVLRANALLKELEHKPCSRVLVCESRLSKLIETSVGSQEMTSLNAGK